MKFLLTLLALASAALAWNGFDRSCTTTQLLTVGSNVLLEAGCKDANGGGHTALLKLNECFGNNNGRIVPQSKYASRFPLLHLTSSF